MFFDKKLSGPSDVYYLEPYIYHSHMNTAQAMNNLIQERHTHSESFSTAKMSRRKQLIEIYLANGGSGLAFVVRTWNTFPELTLAII